MLLEIIARNLLSSVCISLVCHCYGSHRLLIMSQVAKISQGEPLVARILIVDDDKAIRLFLRAALERGGHAIVEAGSGDGGLRCYQAEPNDLVITDEQLPGRDSLK